MNNLLSSSTPIQLVRRLPAQDALILIKERGLQDSLEIIELLSPEQVQNMFDLDVWDDDHIKSESVETWLEAMLEANPSRAIQVFHELDPEFLAYLFKINTQVYELDDGQEQDGLTEERVRTPDNQYVVTFTKHIWRVFFEQFMARDLEFALQIIQSVRFETASGLEEESLRWRDSRMQDLGFAPFEESKAILAYLDPNSPLPPANEGYDEQDSIGSSSALLSFMKPKSVFKQALSELSEKSQARILRELVSTCNRVHIAMKRDPGEIAALKETVTYVILMVEKALEHLSVDKLAKAPLAKLFQVGRSL
ncbi:MAG: DUF6178 family protein [Myxococcaceae bacterium]